MLLTWKVSGRSLANFAPSDVTIRQQQRGSEPNQARV